MEYTNATYDARKFKLCCPWPGKRGAPWTLVFKPAFEDACRGQIDTFASWHETLVTETDFGGANGLVHPGGPGTQLNVNSTSSRRTRIDAIYSAILLHACQLQGNNERVKAHVANVLTGAPTLAAVAAANAAIAAANAANAANALLAPPGPVVAVPAAAVGVPNVLPADWLPRLWRWMDVNIGAAVQNGMLDSTHIMEFSNIKITDVGISRDTPQLFMDLLVRHNNQRRVALPPNDLWIKFHQQITFPRALADRSLNELLNPSFVIPAGLPFAGQPDLQPLVDVYTDVWHAVWDRGVEIKPQAPPGPRPERSARVDGMSVNLLPDDAYDDLPPLYTPEFGVENLTQALAAAETRERDSVSAYEFLKSERNCWRCGGWGHTKEDCPSDPSVKRSKAACIKGLQMLLDQEKGRLKSFQNRRIIRKPGRSPGRAPTPVNPTAHDAELVQYDDGGVYSMTGEEIIPPPDLVRPADSVEQPSSATALTATAVPIDMDRCGTSTPEVPPTMPEAKTREQSPADVVHAAIEHDFMSGYSAEAIAGSPPNDQFERYDVTNGKSTVKAAVVGALSAAMCIAGVAALAARSVRGRAILTLLALGSTTGASVGLELARPTCVKVHASNFSRFQGLGSEPKAKGAVPASAFREHGIMDSGTTACASGREKLFPSGLIEQLNPPIKVEIASGVSLAVAALGTIRLPVRRAGTTSAKKLLHVLVPHSLRVPHMPVTLISTKALFAHCNIRTYFNDDLCMLFPDGSMAYFVETATNYTIQFDGDTTPIEVQRRSRHLAAVATRADAHVSLRQPLPFTWDLAHSRFCHFSPERIHDSAAYVRGQNISSLGTRNRASKPCLACIRGAFRGHRHGKRPPGVFTRFGQRIYSDSCVMPKSTPFGFTEMYIFLDAWSKFIAVYFGKSTKAAEMELVFKQFIADYGRYMAKGVPEEWYADGGPEFKSASLELFCAEMCTRRRFIAPWNPWMNVSETGWRIILRPLRIVMAASNVSVALWPFAVAHIVKVHNSLSSSSHSTSSDVHPVAALAFAFAASLKPAPPSPYYLVTGKQADLTNLRVLFCECYVKIRNKDDLRRHLKPEPLTMRAIYLGDDSRAVGALMFIFDVQRFTTASYNDTYFTEDVMPRCHYIVGRFEFRGMEGHLPTELQQSVDSGGTYPELADVHTPPVDVHPADVPGLPARDVVAAEPPRNPNHGDSRTFRERHCTHPQCEYDIGHPGPHSFEIDAARGPRDRRPRAVRERDVANVVTAVEGDITGCLAAVNDRGAYAVAAAGDGPSQIVVAYNTRIVDDDPPGTPEVKLPTNTKEALEGPDKEEWLAAYQKDLAAKIKNGTFTLVPRPKGRKVIPTKVAHAHKRENDADSQAITEKRARWVGMGFMQSEHDFNETYCATPNAASCRMFACLILYLGLYTAKGDVTKAFTLNPIDVEMYVEQMPGMQTRTDSSGRTWPHASDVVCLLHKCLEGLRQAGNVWQTAHSEFCNGLELPKHFAKVIQSLVEPTLFIAHCSAGIIAFLVWVDDLWVAFSAQSLYDEFLQLYKARFPSVHSLGCTKFAGLCIDYKRGQSMVIHQRPHIERAYQTFITDKVAASKSPAVHRPAVSDRDSKFHYSKLHLAANDGERRAMASVPYLAALATMMYKVHFTSAHLNYYTSFLGQFMHDPSPMAWLAVQELIIYDYHNRDVDVIMYGGEPSIPRAVPVRRVDDFLKSLGFVCYSDASWLLRSPAGYYIFMCNGPVDWAAKLIRVICHSSAEAEIGAGCMLGKRIVFATHFLGEFKVKLKGPAIALIDNTAADELTKKFGVTPKTAHFLRWQHYLRWLVNHNYVEIIFVGTKEQVADILTKVVDISTFLAVCRILFKRGSKAVLPH